jgi:tripartite-type tricarboxylate transporter receptor subunit TctC
MAPPRYPGAAGLILAALVLAALPASRAVAQTAEAFYRGKQVTMLVASGVGGGYDTYARALARHLGEHIPGKPLIVPKNVPGAAGLIAASTLYNSTAPDGLTFAALTNGIAMDPLFGTNQGRFDALKMKWLGSIGKLENICATWYTSPIKTIAQAQQREIVVSAAGATSNTGLMPRLMNDLIGTRFKVVGGYTEGSGVTLSLENGEVGGVCGISYSTLKTMRPNWFRDKKLNIILQIGLKKLPDLPEVPNAIDLVKNAEDRQVLQLILVRQEMGRPFAMPPGVPADRVAALRAAFAATMKDPAFLADAKKLQLEVDPLSGEEIESLLKSAYATPAPIVARAAKLVGPLN